MLPAPLDRRTLADLPRSGRVLRRGESEAPRASVLAALADRLPAEAFAGETSRDAVLAYVALLDRVLEDRRLDEGEVAALGHIAGQWGLSVSAVAGIHRRYFAGLRALALEDGDLSASERDDLVVMAALLSADNRPFTGRDEPTLVAADRRADFAGMTVCFTGSSVCSIDGVPLARAMQEDLATEAGLIAADGVTKKLDLLVLADPASNSGKARKARAYGIRLIAERAFWAALGVRVD